MVGRMLTPSKITAWLDCGHYLTLRHECDRGARDLPVTVFGEMARMLLDKGDDHERQVLERYRAAGRAVFEVPARERGESFAAHVDRVGDVLGAGHDVVFQLPFAHDGIRGIADFLERVVSSDGAVSYEPVDAKLARNAAKPGHVLQLCFYAEALTALTGTAPEHVHIELGSGERQTIRVAEVMAYWRRLRSELADVVAAPPAVMTRPEPCDHCAFCEFESVCEEQWRSADSLVHVAGARSADRALLETGGVETIAGLAALDREVADVDPVRLTRLAAQAKLQVRAREAPTDPPPHELLTSAIPPVVQGSDPAAAGPDAGASRADPGPPLAEPALTGFAALPRPDDGDIFLDYEGHPFWKPDVGLFFLFGLIERVGLLEAGPPAPDVDRWRFRAFWAHDREHEARATQDLVRYLIERRERFPNMHVYHYNHTERSALVRLAEEYGVVELEVEELITSGLFVDLYPVVTGGIRIGAESYGLKSVERLTGFRRSEGIDRGAGAVVEYESWMGDGDPARLTRIARYNEDDVRATMAVRDWLAEHRPADVVWRSAVMTPPDETQDLDARIEALHSSGPGTDEHLMGDLLGYWRRERAVVAADCLRLSMADEHEQFEAMGAITRLTSLGLHERISPKTGRTLKGMQARFSFPAQPIDADIGHGSRLIVALAENEWSFFTVEALDRAEGTLAVRASAEMIESGLVPASLVHWDHFHEGAKLTALCDLADQMIDGDASAVAHAMLRREPSAFLPGHGPEGGLLIGGHEQVSEWAQQLDRSYLPIQGPPGTGKTFTGAHVIHALVQGGKRVGIMAMSHRAIDNLMQAVADLFAELGSTLRAVRKSQGGPVTGVDYVDDNRKCASGEYDVVAGTPWFFANRAMRDNPVDVLVVDEAGQLGLADTLAASISATDVILLGDPQQLPQVARAVHPNRSGVSALEHLLGEGVRTFPPERGVLLDVTWRMHPDVSEFISDVMYEGRLTSEESCAGQTTVAGTGLRWIRAEHTGCSTESPQEADLVAATIDRLLGTGWTDRHGRERSLGADDIIVVTPYNDQRRLITSTLGADPAMAAVEVGTVDKFQGREAVVVLFSMATSSAEFMPRNADFLFSKNRLNVAVSRARCLAYLICTDELLATRARDVEQMKLISALCEFVERSERAEGGALLPHPA